MKNVKLGTNWPQMDGKQEPKVFKLTKKGEKCKWCIEKGYL